jgi:CRISPR/Cas system-associated endonuclease/helicase Cas3
VSYFAHSPDKKRSVQAQRYEHHIENVKKLALQFINDIFDYAKHDGDLLKQIITFATEYHDLGKLAKENQEILSGNKKAKHLPINHVDAGTAHFLRQNNLYHLIAVLIQAHLRCYIDFIDLNIKGLKCLRDRNIDIIKLTDKYLNDYLNIHNSLITSKQIDIKKIINGNRSIFFRLALSCLVDADHTDSACHYGEYLKNEQKIELKPSERLEKMNEYIASLSSKSNNNGERLKLRQEMYNACRDSKITDKIAYCDAPVGSGKTTAIMAHLLKQASERNLRRIYVILPFTNIIKQSVEVYRKSLVLPNENSEEIVAELHHKADFKDIDARHLTALWRAPIIVTTAVTFFETLASNTPSTLRRLHELPGSAIFIDEAHAALPVKLLPLAWRWIYRYAEEWSCYFLLASGSMIKFWQIEQIKITKNNIAIPENIPKIINSDLNRKLSIFENKRVEYKYDSIAKNCEELTNWITKFDGPRLVIMNTVQSAAVLADYFAKKIGLDKVEHLSTALTPNDREKILDNVKKRLVEKDKNWTFIATSCVEAGVDFSFKVGFRELGSTTSLLQASGRINRNGEYGISEMWSFIIKEEGLLKKHPMLKDASEILKKYFERDIEITPELSTISVEDEITISGKSNDSFKELINAEENSSFPLVEEKFKVIANDTRLVVVDKDLVEKIKNYEKLNWHELQKKSVQIWGYKLNELKILEIRDGIYEWNLEYNDFIGYMAGLIDVKKVELGKMIMV